MIPTLHQYLQFQQLNFPNPGTSEQYNTDINNLHPVEGWVVNADPEKDIKNGRENYKNFQTYFQSGSSYAAVYIANQDLKRVVYIPWTEKSVFYCPPDAAGKPQNLDEPLANQHASGYLNYMSADTEVIFSDNDKQEWKKMPINKVFNILAQGLEFGGTISTNHTNRVIIRTV